ncbi:hypothetical protein HMPREF1148_0478 [Selenomonas sp. FOBRC6]|nr:hypothetical protein HMPREF1148_0478 [Selenomonas sp. FOBRC6]
MTFAGMLIRKDVYFSFCERCVMIDLPLFFCYNITSIFILLKEYNMTSVCERGNHREQS